MAGEVVNRVALDGAEETIEKARRVSDALNDVGRSAEALGDIPHEGIRKVFVQGQEIEIDLSRPAARTLFQHVQDREAADIGARDFWEAHDEFERLGKELDRSGIRAARFAGSLNSLNTMTMSLVTEGMAQNMRAQVKQTEIVKLGTRALTLFTIAARGAAAAQYAQQLSGVPGGILGALGLGKASEWIKGGGIGRAIAMIPKMLKISGIIGVVVLGLSAIADSVGRLGSALARWGIPDFFIAIGERLGALWDLLKVGLRFTNPIDMWADVLNRTKDWQENMPGKTAMDTANDAAQAWHEVKHGRGSFDAERRRREDAYVERHPAAEKAYRRSSWESIYNRNQGRQWSF